MSNNIFNKSIKELYGELAQAIFDEIKVPRVGSQHIRVAGYTRDVLEGVYLALDKLLANKNREAYKICFIAERAGKTVPITPIEQVMEYRTKPSIKGLIVFDPWKIEEYGRNSFLLYSFRDYPIEKVLEHQTMAKIETAPPKIRALFHEVRQDFAGNFPALERPLREALFMISLSQEGFSFPAFGRNLIFFNCFPDASLTEKNAASRIAQNSRLSRLFIHSRLPMNERILLLCPRDKDTSISILKFFVGRDGVLPEFWLLEIVEDFPDLFFDKWSSSFLVPARRQFVAHFEGIGKDRVAEPEIIVTWEMPYGTVDFGAIAFRIWSEESVVNERVARSGGEQKFILNIAGIEPGIYQIQVVLSASDSRAISESWSAPFVWPSKDPKSAKAVSALTAKLTWLHGAIASDQPTALYHHLREEPLLKRRKPELIETAPRINPVPFAGGDGVQELVLPDHTRFFMRVPEAFRLLEKIALEEFKGLRSYVLDLSVDKPEVEAIEMQPTEMPEEFLKHRRLLIMQLRRSGSFPSAANFASFANLCINYLNAYLSLLDKILKSRAKVIRDELLFLDTVVLKKGDKVLGILTLPTHPLEIAFRLGHQQMISDVWQAVFRSRSSHVSKYPPKEGAIRSQFLKIMSSKEGSHFVLVEVPHPGFGLFLAENTFVSELWSAWDSFIPTEHNDLLEKGREPIRQCLTTLQMGRSVSVAVSGISNHKGLMRFLKVLSESIPDPEVEFDVTCYGTPDGVIDRTRREIELLKRNYCLYDLSADPDVWRERFPYDRVRLHAPTDTRIDSFHLSVIIPDFSVVTESFESRDTCALTFLKGLYPIHLGFDRAHGDLQWSGAGPKKDSPVTENIPDIVDAVRDFFTAVSSKVSLQKTAAFSHLAVKIEIPAVKEAFLRKLIGSSITSVIVSNIGAADLGFRLAPPDFAVGSSWPNVAVAVNLKKTKAFSLLTTDGPKHWRKDHNAAAAAIRDISPVPLSLFTCSDSKRLVSNILTRRMLSLLSQTRDGILVEPNNYPDFFPGGPWPMLILFKFGSESVIPLVVEPLELRGIDKPDNAVIPPEFLERLNGSAERLEELFKRMSEEPDGMFTWTRFGEILASELQLSLMKSEIAVKDAEELAGRINAVVHSCKAPTREVIREFPVLMLPDAKGQLTGRPFPNVHPLCRVISGEEMAQWISK
ncbi:MAG: hypothetical protein WC712_11375 [Candidatus Brocadiia bacterium]